jgi:hypothetical protein
VSIPTRLRRRIVGLASDRPGAGKTTAADYLVEKHGFKAISIGAAVKNELDRMLQIHGFRYHEAEKEDYRPALSWWTEFRIKYSSEDYWLDEALKLSYDQDSLLLPDLRYPNEVDYVKAQGGLTVQIVRPSAERSNLESEVALDGYVFDWVVDNSRNDGGESMFEALDKIIASSFK